MMKKFFICLCLILSLCACQGISESDDENEAEVTQIEDDTLEDTQDIAVEDSDETTDSHDTESDNNTTSSNDDSSTTDQSISDSNTSNSQKTTDTSDDSAQNNNTTSQSSNSTTSHQTSSNKTSETSQETKIYCTYTIDCSSILNHTDALESNYQVPSNGIIYSQAVEIEDGDTVLSILKRIGVSTDISLGYVKGIDGLYEFDCGSESGWMYSVNGTKPNVGASKYSVSEDDEIKWVYVISRSEW